MLSSHKGQALLTTVIVQKNEELKKRHRPRSYLVTTNPGFAKVKCPCYNTLLALHETRHTLKSTSTTTATTPKYRGSISCLVSFSRLSMVGKKSLQLINNSIDSIGTKTKVYDVFQNHSSGLAI